MICTVRNARSSAVAAAWAWAITCLLTRSIASTAVSASWRRSRTRSSSSLMFSFLPDGVDQFTETGTRPVEARADRSQRYVKGVGDGVVAEFLEGHQQQDIAFLVGELHHGMRQTPEKV